MARTKMRKTLTVADLEERIGERYTWRSKTGIEFFLKPLEAIDRRGRKQFNICFYEYMAELRTEGLLVTNGVWTVPKLWDAGAVYLGRIYE